MPFTHTGDLVSWLQKETRKNAIVEYLDYQVPVTQQKRNGDMQAAKRD